MWFGPPVAVPRPRCACLVALPGILNPQIPQFLTVIDLAEWPHWSLWGYCLIGIDPIAEGVLGVWLQTHPEG